MTSKEIVKQTLANWKLPILQEGENTVIVRYQMSYVQIGSLQEGSHAIAVTLTGVFTADDEREERLALKVNNEINCSLMQVKLYLDDDNDLVIASEFFYKDDDDVEFLLNYALREVVSAKNKFIQHYSEAEDDDKLIQELNDD